MSDPYSQTPRTHMVQRQESGLGSSPPPKDLFACLLAGSDRKERSSKKEQDKVRENERSSIRWFIPCTSTMIGPS